MEVENHIKQYLYKSATFKLGPKKYLGNNKIFKDREFLFEISDESKDLQIYHYIMAKEGTEAGDYYNPFALELIKQQYNSFNDRKAINIPEEIIKLFSELSTDIIGEKMDLQKVDNNLIKLKEDNKNDNTKKKKKMQVQNAYIDQDGNYLKNKGKFEPKYSMYYYKEKKKSDDEDDDEDSEEYDKYLLLRLEIPGNVVRLTARSTDPKIEKFKGIVIKKD